MSSLLALTGGGGGEAGFRQDARFALAPRGSSAPAASEMQDPVALAWAEGYGHGLEQARGEAEAVRIEEEAARVALGLSLTRIDAELAETLRQKLQDTVMALCEATLVPFALDPDALAKRVERAVAMLSRAEDERVIRLNPADLKLVSSKLAKDWKVVGDPSIERGALRVETQSGGVEDGPAQWRLALAEAFHAC